MNKARLGKLWAQMKCKKKATFTGVDQLPADYTVGGGKKKLYKYPAKVAKLAKLWKGRFKKKATHGKIPKKLVARFSNIGMDKYSVVYALFMREGSWSTNGVEYYYPWDVIKKYAQSYIGRAFYKEHEDRITTELGKIIGVSEVVVDGVRWLKARIQVPEVSFTTPILDRIKNGLIERVSSTHHFTYKVTPEGRVVDSITGRGISVLGAHEDQEVDDAHIVDIQRNLVSSQYKKKMRCKLGNLMKKR